MGSDFAAPFVEVEDWVVARVGESVAIAKVVVALVAGVGVLSAVVLLIVVVSSSTEEVDELSVSAGSVDVVAAAVVFLLSEVVSVVFGVAFADVVDVVSVFDVLGSLSAKVWAVSSASSILDCGIALPIVLHTETSGVMKVASNVRISSGQL